MDFSGDYDSSVPSPSEFITIFEDESDISLEDWYERDEEMETSGENERSQQGVENIVNWNFDEDWPMFERDDQGNDILLTRRTSPTEAQATHTEDERSLFIFCEGPAQGGATEGAMFYTVPEGAASSTAPEGAASTSVPEEASSSANRRGGRRYDRVTVICETDEDVTPELRQVLIAFRRQRDRQAQRSRERRARSARGRRNVGVRENVNEENESVAGESSLLADELFGGDNSALEFEWLPMESFPHRQETFQPATAPGPRQPTTSAYDAFRQFWDDEILNHIVLETNRYACELKSTSSRYANEWYDTNVHEVLTLFAFWMMLGIIQMPTINSCFSNNYLIKTDFFRTLFTKHRYWLLNGALHFVDNATRNENSSKLFPLGPILDHLNSKFSGCYTLHRDVTIDESLTLWKGNLSFKQYIKTKSARFGIKTFELCESSTGYLWAFVPYLGKDSPRVLSSVVPKTTEVVVGLIRPLLNQGYRVFMDNWFNSPLLARYLKRNHTDCVGTLRVNRQHVPPIVKLQKLQPGQCIARHCGDAVVMAFHDKKTVYTISTHHGTEDIEVQGRRGRLAQYKPVVIDDYNKYMGGVDRKDQMLEPYLVERKRCKKWYKKMFKRLLNASILNSRVIVAKSAGSQPQQLAFRLELIDKIVKRHKAHVPVPRQISNINASLPPDHRFANTHFIVRLPRPDDTAGSSRPFRSRQQCQWCTERWGRYKKSSYMCDRCEVPLCLEECFKNYHDRDMVSRLYEQNH